MVNIIIFRYDSITINVISSPKSSFYKLNSYFVKKELNLSTELKDFNKYNVDVLDIVDIENYMSIAGYIWMTEIV